MNHELPALIDSACGGDPGLRSLYDDIVKKITEKAGATPDGTKLIRICDYVRLEKIKGQLSRDIEERGVGRTETNGRQRYWKDNKSMSLLLKYMSQQQSILKSLGLGGAEPGVDMDEDDDDGFDDV